MLIKRRRGWELPEKTATPEAEYFSRRSFGHKAMMGALAYGITSMSGGDKRLAMAQEVIPALLPPNQPPGGLYPAKRNERYTLDQPLTPEDLAISYNNFYEFGSHKAIAEAAQALTLNPWPIEINGLVETPLTIDAETLIGKMPLEERLYRHRCVEAWSMRVPWTGFPLKALVDMARPLSSARYLKMVTFSRPTEASGQQQFWYPWPYVEGVTMAEAVHELAFLVTGLYGKPLPKQSGAPLRLALPWKYGFKSIKSIVRFEFTAERPKSFWEELQASEYGFWANVNPEVPHPRWSQATERDLETRKSLPTRLFNGYEAFVSDLYKGMEEEKLYM
jgi:methionine sulfoxide reductase catalytic subunit